MSEQPFALEVAALDGLRTRRTTFSGSCFSQKEGTIPWRSLLYPNSVFCFW